MTRFVNDIAKRYADRIILFDSPPVLARSEAMVLAQHVGQVVFVVEAERTSRHGDERGLGHDRECEARRRRAQQNPTDSFAKGFGYYEYRNR